MGLFKKKKKNPNERMEEFKWSVPGEVIFVGYLEPGPNRITYFYTERIFSDLVDLNDDSIASNIKFDLFMRLFISPEDFTKFRMETRRDVAWDYLRENGRLKAEFRGIIDGKNAPCGVIMEQDSVETSDIWLAVYKK